MQMLIFATPWSSGTVLPPELSLPDVDLSHLTSSPSP